MNINNDWVSEYGKTGGTILANKMTVLPGEYEVVNYTYEGGAHSGDMVELHEPTEGLVIDEVWEGDFIYNVALRNVNGSLTIIGVPKDRLEKA